MSGTAGSDPARRTAVYPVWMVWLMVAAGAAALLVAGVLLDLALVSSDVGPDGLRRAALLVGLACLVLGTASIATPYASTLRLRGGRTV